MDDEERRKLKSRQDVTREWRSNFLNTNNNDDGLVFVESTSATGVNHYNKSNKTNLNSSQSMRSNNDNNRILDYLPPKSPSPLRPLSTRNRSKTTGGISNNNDTYNRKSRSSSSSSTRSNPSRSRSRNGSNNSRSGRRSKQDKERKTSPNRHTNAHYQFNRQRTKSHHSEEGDIPMMESSNYLLSSNRPRTKSYHSENGDYHSSSYLQPPPPSSPTLLVPPPSTPMWTNFQQQQQHDHYQQQQHKQHYDRPRSRTHSNEEKTSPARSSSFNNRNNNRTRASSHHSEDGFFPHNNDNINNNNNHYENNHYQTTTTTTTTTNNNNNSKNNSHHHLDVPSLHHREGGDYSSILPPPQHHYHHHPQQFIGSLMMNRQRTSSHHSEQGSLLVSSSFDHHPEEEEIIHSSPTAYMPQPYEQTAKEQMIERERQSRKERGRARIKQQLALSNHNNHDDHMIFNNNHDDYVSPNAMMNQINDNNNINHIPNLNGNAPTGQVLGDSVNNLFLSSIEHDSVACTVGTEDIITLTNDHGHHDDDHDHNNNNNSNHTDIMNNNNNNIISSEQQVQDQVPLGYAMERFLSDGVHSNDNTAAITNTTNNTANNDKNNTNNDDTVTLPSSNRVVTNTTNQLNNNKKDDSSIPLPNIIETPHDVINTRPSKTENLTVDKDNILTNTDENTDKNSSSSGSHPITTGPTISTSTSIPPLDSIREAHINFKNNMNCEESTIELENDNNPMASSRDENVSNNHHLESSIATNYNGDRLSISLLEDDEEFISSRVSVGSESPHHISSSITNNNSDMDIDDIYVDRDSTTRLARLTEAEILEMTELDYASIGNMPAHSLRDEPHLASFPDGVSNNSESSGVEVILMMPEDNASQDRFTQTTVPESTTSVASLELHSTIDDVDDNSNRVISPSSPPLITPFDDENNHHNNNNNNFEPSNITAFSAQQRRVVDDSNSDIENGSHTSLLANGSSHSEDGGSNHLSPDKSSSFNFDKHTLNNKSNENLHDDSDNENGRVRNSNNTMCSPNSTTNNVYSTNVAIGNNSKDWNDKKDINEDDNYINFRLENSFSMTSERSYKEANRPIHHRLAVGIHSRRSGNNKSNSDGRELQHQSATDTSIPLMVDSFDYDKFQQPDTKHNNHSRQPSTLNSRDLYQASYGSITELSSNSKLDDTDSLLSHAKLSGQTVPRSISSATREDNHNIKNCQNETKVNFPTHEQMSSSRQQVYHRSPNLDESCNLLIQQQHYTPNNSNNKQPHYDDDFRYNGFTNNTSMVPKNIINPDNNYFQRFPNNNNQHVHFLQGELHNEHSYIPMTIEKSKRNAIESVFSSVRSLSTVDIEAEMNDTHKYLAGGMISRAFPERFFTLIVTLVIEIPVLLMISGGSDRLCKEIGRTKYQLLMAFLPLSSAISGNVGLQCNALTSRAISHIHVTVDNYFVWLRAELGASFVLGLSMGCVLGTIAYFASGNDLTFAFTIFTSQFVSINTAGLTGTFAPLIIAFLFHRDSGKWCGPLETAVQDIVGSFTMVILSYHLIVFLGPSEIDQNDTCG